MVSNEIILACKRKEDNAFKLCYEACAPYAFTVVKSYIYDVNYRQDAMQEVFASLFLSIPNYDQNKGEFKAWFAQLVVRTCIDILRKRKKVNFLVPIQEDHDNPQEIDFMFNLNKKEIESLLAHMPDGYRTVFLLSVIDDYSHEEIASMLNITKVTSRSQLSRAIKWIRKNLSVQTKKMIYG